MDVYITISNVGNDAGPFDLYSNLDGYISAFETNVPKASLEAGYFTSLVPDGTTQIKIQSVSTLCKNYVNVGTVPLEYYFIASDYQPSSGFFTDFINKGTYCFVLGNHKGYWNGTYEVPGNHLTKMNGDLTVDESFDIGEGFGQHYTYIGATMTELYDGSIIVVGFFTSFEGENFNRIIKLNSDGSINRVFNVGTGFNNYSTSISETNDGKYYIGGLFSTYNGVAAPKIIKLLSDGSKDVSFNPGGGFNNTTLSTLVNFNNSVYVTGYYSIYNGIGANGIIKLNPDGTKDTSFDYGSGFEPRSPYSGVIMARIPGEEAFYCVSYCAYGYCGPGVYWQTYKGVNYGNIVKLLPNGDVDTTFNPGGSGFNGGVGLIDVVFGDKLLVTSTDPAFTEYNGVPTAGVILLNSDGSILQTFAIEWFWVYAVGNQLFGSDLNGDGYNKLIYTYTGDITTTTTTTTI
jgi:hypothetical protein